MPCLTNFSNTAATAISADSTNTVTYGVTLKCDANNNGAVFWGLANTITIQLANTNTVNDATVGFPLAAGASYTITPGHFKKAGVAALPSNVYVITNLLNQRVFFDIL